MVHYLTIVALTGLSEGEVHFEGTRDNFRAPKLQTSGCWCQLQILPRISKPHIHTETSSNDSRPKDTASPSIISRAVSAFAIAPPGSDDIELRALRHHSPSTTPAPSFDISSPTCPLQTPQRAHCRTTKQPTPTPVPTLPPLTNPSTPQ